MLVLVDCIGYPSEKIPQDLINQIKYVGEIIEIKAVAYKSLKALAKNNKDNVLSVDNLRHD